MLGSDRKRASTLRLALLTTLLVAATVLFVWTRCKPPAKELPPIVAFVVLDAVRADHLSVCGYDRPTTPYLEQLREEGAAVTCRAYAPGSWTLPSHASFFTGQDVVAHGAHNIQQETGQGVALFSPDNVVNPLGSDLRTLAERFRERGFVTISVSANPLINGFTGLTRGFDVVRAARRSGDFHGPRLIPSVAGVLAAQAAHGRKPLLLFVNIADAHTPWYEIPSGLSWLAPGPWLLGYRRGEGAPIWTRYVKGELGEEEAAAVRTRVRDLYDYGVFNADRNLRRLVELLREYGEGRSPIRLVITSDHGEFLGEHGLLDHGHYLWEENVRVPLVVVDADRSVELPEPVSAMYAYDLVLGEYGRPPPPVVSFGYPSEQWYRRSDGHVGGTSSVAMWSGDSKLLWQDGKTSLFDLRADPDEKSPRDPSGHPLLPGLREQVKRYLAPTENAPVDPEMIEVLRSMGYME